jgi:hypothetical protein
MFEKNYSAILESSLLLAIGMFSIVLGLLSFESQVIILAFIVVLVVWVIVWDKGKDFAFLFFLLFFIGYFQGIASKIGGDRIPQSLWGLTKYEIIGVMLISLIARLMTGHVHRTTMTLRKWMWLWVINCFFFCLFMVEAIEADPSYSPILTIQSFGLGNMLLMVLTYYSVTKNQVDIALKLLVWSGIVAAIAGVCQRIFIHELLALVLADKSQMNFLSNTPTFEGFRAFSFFDTHHAFSAFLIFACVALQILRLQKKVRPLYYWLSMGVLWAGFAVTFNFTNIISCLIVLMIIGVLENQKKGISFPRAFLRQAFSWRSLALVFLGLLVAFSASATMRERLISVLDVSESSFTSDIPGAGRSLFLRLQGTWNGTAALASHPAGLGLWLTPFSQWGDRYARYGSYFSNRGELFTGDEWFLFLAVQIGLPLFLLYAALYLLPIAYGWKNCRHFHNSELRILANGMLALMIVTFLAGASNSPILVFSPTNFLIWAAAGVLMKAKSWDDQLFLAERSQYFREDDIGQDVFN